ncbi:acetyl-CoA acetyltransferase [Candidatus Bathyarchaeota archaeon ex4484_205]|nr:MAG: acetyl-CoA acetyltransferase [Candidatus Bathyarchaeota archaeon ex4484_205]
MSVFIRGISALKVGEHWNRSLRSLGAEAGINALEDASLSTVDAIYVGNMCAPYLQAQSHIGALIADYMGLSGVPAVHVEAACASGGAALHEACKAVLSGEYNNVLCIGVEKLSDMPTSQVSSSLASADDRVFSADLGMTFVGLNALLHRLYMHHFQVPPEKIAELAVLSHAHALNNPYAQYHLKLTVENVMSSPLIADPIHLLECAAISDGAAAVVLSREKGDIKVIASTMSSDYLSLHERTDLLSFSATQRAVMQAYKQANLSPKDIHIVEVHDAFTIMGVISLEDMGFAKRGEAAELIEAGYFNLNGELPINTLGGLKARGHPVGATGIYQVVDLVKQLRGDAGANQIDNAIYGLAQNVGGIGGTVTIHILEGRC